ncbi:DNA repair protein RadA [bacterium]|nr:DNA repair protein RadA [bacterium]NBW56948.1 DNA repair protein RadA [bacterium]NBX71923.1 DNA repair protein RadA [bacterium]
MSKKAKIQYVCQACGSLAPRWTGQCAQCSEYNTISQEAILVSPNQSSQSTHYAGSCAEVMHYDALTIESIPRFSSHNSELDRSLGGGFVPGALCILSGDPGVGKSTLTLQVLSSLSSTKKCLYVSGEESLSQIKLRGERLKIYQAPFLLAAQTELESVLTILQQHKPDFIVIDSIQTLHSQHVDQMSGSVNQIRYCAHTLTRYAKQHNATVLIIGHVNKEGVLAGPKVFEHMVDTVLHIESDDQGRYRLLRTLKNRFGAVNELGILCMTKEGLKPVVHPSALFTNWHADPTSGTVVTALWEGSRVLLIEIQALVVDSPQYQARRLVVGFDVSRLNLLLAVLSRLKDWPGSRFDVFLNVVGGLKIQETAADCALLAAVYASLKNIIIPRDVIIFGEIGLGGELRPVQYALERVKEALKHGYKKIFLPKANSAGLAGQSEVVFLANVSELLDQLSMLTVDVRLGSR